MAVSYLALVSEVSDSLLEQRLVYQKYEIKHRVIKTTPITPQTAPPPKHEHRTRTLIVTEGPGE